MLTEARARHLAESWIVAWNGRELEGIMAHYAEDVEFWSPIVVMRLGIAEGKIAGREQLRSYFARGLEVAPALRFELIDVLLGVESLTIYYRRETGARVAETAVVNDQGQVVQSRAHYQPPHTRATLTSP